MSLKDKLVGPTEEEVLDNLKYLYPDDMLIKSCKNGFLKGVEVALERGADFLMNKYDDYLTKETVDIINGVRTQQLNDEQFNINVEIIRIPYEGLDSKFNYSYVTFTKKDGNPYLKYACEYGHYDIVKFLLEKSVSPNSTDDVILKMTECRGFLNIVELLKSYM